MQINVDTRGARLILFLALLIFLLPLLALVTFVYQALARDARKQATMDGLPIPLPTTRNPRLVAIFPEATQETLNYHKEKRILAQAGGPWQLVIMEGTQATRQGIATELHKGGARLIYFGGHGTQDRLFVSLGEDIGAAWLARIVRLHKIEALVLNACVSDTLASACLNAGAHVVVASSDKVPDAEAGLLATALLDGLARRGATMEDAVEYAVTTVEDATADMIRLRGNATWHW